MRYLLFLSALCSACASSDGRADSTSTLQNADHSFSFPSETGASSSPSGALVASHVDPGPDQYGIHEYRLSISDRNGKPLETLAFTRSVAGSWAPRSDSLFINNYVGSNLTDCLVTLGDERRLELVSLTRQLLAQDGDTDNRNKLGISYSPDNSHFYLVCNGWIDASTLDVALTGYEDAGRNIGPQFSYRFRYLVRDQSFELNSDHEH